MKAKQEEVEVWAEEGFWVHSGWVSGHLCPPREGGLGLGQPHPWEVLGAGVAGDRAGH